MPRVRRMHRLPGRAIVGGVAVVSHMPGVPGVLGVAGVCAVVVVRRALGVRHGRMAVSRRRAQALLRVLRGAVRTRRGARVVLGLRVVTGGTGSAARTRTLTVVGVHVFVWRHVSVRIPSRSGDIC